MQNSRLQSKIKKVQDADVSGKRIFLRLDLDVSLENGKISDDFRLLAAFTTVEYLLKQNGSITIAGHLGRPEGFYKSLSLEPIAEWFIKKLGGGSRIKIGEFDGWHIGDRIKLLENLRFYKEEEENDEEFARRLSSLAEIYVNDAFGDSHRNHASIVGVPKFLPHFAGLRFQKEVEELSKVLENPKRPLTIIIGGAKIETKLPLIEKMHHFSDYVLVGGQLAKETKTLLKMQHEKVEEKKAILFVADTNPEGLDITIESTENFIQVINNSQTIVWNGPLGKIPGGEKASRKIANEISKSSAYTVVGGGDTVSFLKKMNLFSKFSFVSTGGGAMLEFLSGEKLPGLHALL